ncbi:NAD(P)-dependent alcohol dehydrogenase [Neorhizobium sp. DT-125]|uniref:NAD(P)-dependent alcohol dehydrogenase n=1 Tax=Neorhizobium sp. DT-125 TaxID=3396163 RepID=UPI003F1D874C
MTKMRSLVLEKKGELALRDIDLPLDVGPGMVKIAIHTVGVCGSDVHYYTHGRIGPFVVNKPMVLGHEASGTVVEVGEGVNGLKIGDRVCMEPGIPDPNSRASQLGLYNVDPAVNFWATPPIHGVLTSEVVHPAKFTFKLPDHVSFAEGAMIEPFAVGLQAAQKARIAPGDIGVVIGAGPIGIMIALAALGGGCAQIIIADIVDENLATAAQYPGIRTVNAKRENLAAVVSEVTGEWGADIVFEASGAAAVWKHILALPRPAGCIVVVGLPVEPTPVDWSLASTREIRFETVFRYAHQYPRAIQMMSSGRIDLKPLITETYPFHKSIEAFERAAEGRPSDVKLQIRVAN